jgi:hypothetical protein
LVLQQRGLGLTFWHMIKLNFCNFKYISIYAVLRDMQCNGQSLSYRQCQLIFFLSKFLSHGCVPRRCVPKRKLQVWGHVVTKLMGTGQPGAVWPGDVLSRGRFVLGIHSYKNLGDGLSRGRIVRGTESKGPGFSRLGVEHMYLASCFLMLR